MRHITSKKIGGWQRTVKKLNSAKVLKARYKRYTKYRKALKLVANNLHRSARIQPKTIDDEHHKQSMNYAYAHVAHALWTIDQAILTLEALLPEIARKKAPFYYEVHYEKEPERKPTP